MDCTTDEIRQPNLIRLTLYYGIDDIESWAVRDELWDASTREAVDERSELIEAGLEWRGVVTSATMSSENLGFVPITRMLVGCKDDSRVGDLCRSTLDKGK